MLELFFAITGFVLVAVLVTGLLAYLDDPDPERPHRAVAATFLRFVSDFAAGFRPRRGLLRVLGLVAVVFFAGGALAGGDDPGPAAANASPAVAFFFKFLSDHLDTILLVGTPLVLGLVAALFARITRPQQDTLLGAVKGAYSVLSAVAPSTPWKWDDAIAALLRQVEAEMGRRLKPREKARVAGIAASLLASTGPDLVKGPEKTAALLEHVAKVPR